MKTVIGITGSYGSGKTTVAGMLQTVSKADLLDADKIANSLVRKELKPVIIREFGTNNRKKLSRIVFNDSEKLFLLNRIVHPYVKKIMRKGIQDSRKKFIILDVPLLIEANMMRLADIIVVVKCDIKTQMGRIKSGKKEALKRIRAQMPSHEKIRRADFVIDNSGTRNRTKKQVNFVWGVIRREL